MSSFQRRAVAPIVAISEKTTSTWRRVAWALTLTTAALITTTTLFPLPIAQAQKTDGKAPTARPLSPAGKNNAAPGKAQNSTTKPVTLPQSVPEPPAPPPPMDEDEMRRGMAAKTLTLLQKSQATFSKMSGTTCGSCHHQILPVMTFAIAREHGLKLDEALAREQKSLLQKTLDWVGPMLTQAKTDPVADKKLDSGDTVFTLSYLMAGYAAEHREPDAFTDTVARYLLRKQRLDGRFAAYGVRAPMEGNEFTTTALTIRSLAVYTPEEDTATAEAVIGKARTWLANTPTKTNEDRAFRLLGLRWANADAPTLRRATEELLANQNDDGGWSQLPYQLLSSDAYATGQALVALRLGAGLAVEEAAFQRGINYLMAAQRPDGSWYVAKRCNPIVPYFDAGFPGGKDQFISFTASCWATMAMALSLPEQGNLKAVVTTKAEIQVESSFSASLLSTALLSAPLQHEAVRP